MGTRNRAFGGKAVLIAKTLLLWGVLSVPAQGQPPRPSNLKHVLVLDWSILEGGYKQTRINFNAAIQELAAANGFEVTIIAQYGDINALSVSRLAGYQAVIFNNNEAVDRIVPDSLKPGFESWVRNGGGFLSLHMASAFINDWPFMQEALVQRFYGPHGSNRPTATLSHDSEGLKEGAETKAIFKGLTAPADFLDEFISFDESPRGEPGVTILVTVDEKTYSKSIDGPMGEDHPVVWVKEVGKGRVVHNSLGRSWEGMVNVYAQKDAYLKKFLYNSLRYAAGDFIGCTDANYEEYNPDATRSDLAACRTAQTLRTADPTRTPAPAIAYFQGEKTIRVDFPLEREHEVFLADIHGKRVATRSGTGAVRYVLDTPERGGIYIVKATAGGVFQARRIFVP